MENQQETPVNLPAKPPMAIPPTAPLELRQAQPATNPLPVAEPIPQPQPVQQPYVPLPQPVAPPQPLPTLPPQQQAFPQITNYPAQPQMQQQAYVPPPLVQGQAQVVSNVIEKRTAANEVVNELKLTRISHIMAIAGFFLVAASSLLGKPVLYGAVFIAIIPFIYFLYATTSKMKKLMAKYEL